MKGEWTKTYPTEPGWYYVRKSPRQSWMIVLVTEGVVYPGVLIAGKHNEHRADRLDVEWWTVRIAGP